MNNEFHERKPLIPLSPRKKTSISPDSFLFSQRTKKFSRSIDEVLSKIYKSDQRNQLKRLSTKKNKRNKPYSTRRGVILETNFNITLPCIYQNKGPHSKLKLQGKEDQLESLISNFINNKTPKPRITRFREELQKSIDRDLEADKKQYENSLQSISGNEMAEYQRNLNKNLRIEKLRKQNQKRIKYKLRSL